MLKTASLKTTSAPWYQTFPRVSERVSGAAPRGAERSGAERSGAERSAAERSAAEQTSEQTSGPFKRRRFQHNLS